MTALADRAVRFADPVDAGRHGEFRPVAGTPRFAGRVRDAQPGRFHVYGARACPASHRLAIIRAYSGLQDSVSMSYVDPRRDARGWAFRPATGADPVNGFALLREAYLATDPGYDGPVTVPVLWVRWSGRIHSTSAVGIGVDLATRFGSDVLRPPALVAGIDAVTRRIATDVETHLGCSAYRPAAAATLRAALAGFDADLARRDVLVGDRVTDADVRLWVQVVRYDAGPNAHRGVGPRLDAFPHLWRWTSRLYRLDAFRDTTDLVGFSAPLADLPPWT